MNKFIFSYIYKFTCELWTRWNCLVRSFPVHIKQIYAVISEQDPVFFYFIQDPACPPLLCSSCFPGEHISTICLLFPLDVSESVPALHLLTPAHITNKKCPFLDRWTQTSVVFSFFQQTTWQENSKVLEVIRIIFNGRIIFPSAV